MKTAIYDDDDGHYTGRSKVRGDGSSSTWIARRELLYKSNIDKNDDDDDDDDDDNDDNDDDDDDKYTVHYYHYILMGWVHFHTLTKG